MPQPIAKPLFSYPVLPHGKNSPASFLPVSKEEMNKLGWTQCDIIIVTGDAYVDHPSFGMAIIGRFLERFGYRVGIIAQPDWNNAESFKILGQPRLFFGVTSGNMDSMLNRYTAERRLRHDDSYSPDGQGNTRPDRATIVYAQRCKQAYPETPIVLGGIEASLRRLAHYDYWSDKVRRAICADAKADLLLYGNAERALIEIATRLDKGENPQDITDIRGTAYIRTSKQGKPKISGEVVSLPSFDDIANDPKAFAIAARNAQLETNPFNARTLTQAQDSHRTVYVTPPPLPLSTEELDELHNLPFARKPHPVYKGKKIPAFEMIKFSVAIMRGCFGGCSFCAISAHEGRIIQSRSEQSVLNELNNVKNKTPGFTGTISDLGGPSANMYKLGCKKPHARNVCRRLSCLYPKICKNLDTNQMPLVELYRKARSIKGIKRIMVASGIRFDLALECPAYIKELVSHHVGGYLKIAPEHTEAGTLQLMQKPPAKLYDDFEKKFCSFSKKAGKEQYLIPYFIASHPGTSDADMLNVALWLKKNRLRIDQVQNFIPSPATMSTAMYYSGYNPLETLEKQKTPNIVSAKGGRQRKLHKAFLRYHDPENWPLLREALKKMGRTDLIGQHPDKHLVPAHNSYKKAKSHKQGSSKTKRHFHKKKRP